MARLLRWGGYALASIFGLIVVAAIGVWIISSAKLHASAEARPEHLAVPAPSLVGDMERQARTLGCFSCHGEGLRGRKMFDQPMVGTIWSPNLTLVAAHASDQQLAQAIRQGIGIDGRALFIMPSEVFQHLSDQEVAALVGMIRKLPRGGTATPRNSYGPLGRVGVVPGQFKPAPQLVAEDAVRDPIPVRRHDVGRQLAVTRCAVCHAADLSGKEIKPGEVSPGDLVLDPTYPPGRRSLDVGADLSRMGVSPTVTKFRPGQVTMTLASMILSMECWSAFSA